MNNQFNFTELVGTTTTTEVEKTKLKNSFAAVTFFKDNTTFGFFKYLQTWSNKTTYGNQTFLRVSVRYVFKNQSFFYISISWIKDMSLRDDLAGKWVIGHEVSWAIGPFIDGWFTSTGDVFFLYIYIQLLVIWNACNRNIIKRQFLWQCFSVQMSQHNLNSWSVGQKLYYIF